MSESELEAEIVVLKAGLFRAERLIGMLAERIANQHLGLAVLGGIDETEARQEAEKWLLSVAEILKIEFNVPSPEPAPRAIQ